MFWCVKFLKDDYVLITDMPCNVHYFKHTYMFITFVDESDQSSDGGGSQGHSRETSVDRDQSREQSLERRISQQSSSRASLIDGSQGELS